MLRKAAPALRVKRRYCQIGASRRIIRRRSRHIIEPVALLSADDLTAARHQGRGQGLTLSGALALKQMREDLLPDATQIGKLEARTKCLAAVKELLQEREEVGTGEVDQRQVCIRARFC